MVKYKVRKMAKSLLQYHFYCPMLLKQNQQLGIESYLVQHTENILYMAYTIQYELATRLECNAFHIGKTIHIYNNIKS